MKKFMRAISFLVVILIAIVLFPPVGLANKHKDKKDFSREIDNTYVRSDTVQIITIEDEEKYLRKNTEKIYFNYDESVNINALDPGVGSTKVQPYAFGGGGTILQDEKTGIYNNIKDLTMIILGTITSRVSSVVLSVVDYVGKQLAPDKSVTARTFISYRYIGKEGQVWTGYRWETWWDTRSRETYKHYYANWKDPYGYTHSYTVDYIRPNGYEPIRIEYSKHYFDHAYIQRRAWENWYYKRYWVVELWY